jgi:DeoR/GlpR family transcriptional regulator of sugar metabolism
VPGRRCGRRTTGLSEASLEQVQTKERMAARAESSYVLADSSKLGAHIH